MHFYAKLVVVRCMILKLNNYVHCNTLHVVIRKLQPLFIVYNLNKL